MNLIDFLVNDLIVEDTREIRECQQIFLKTRYNEKYFDNQLLYITPSQLFRALNLPTKFVGITGTNGKTTTAFALSYILYRLGYKVATQGTEGFFINLKQVEGRTLTTPTLLTTLKRAVKYKPDFFIMEVSSHGIAQGRVDGIEWSLKIFTSFSQDHLDYHGSLEEYKRVKESFLADATPKVVLRNTPINFNRENGIVVGEGLLERLGDIKLVGDFNRENLALAVAGALVLTGADLDRIIEIAREFEGVPGRMEVVSTDPMIIVDYAHTPDGMERVLKSMEGRKVVVFGAGGERDRGKRVKMGEVAGRLAQFVILTNDNPRCEPPSQIFADLVKGLEKVGTPYIIVPNRVEAIKMGVNLVKRWEWLCKREKGLERLEKFEREAERPIGVLFELEGEGVVIENRVELQLEVKREGREVKEWKRVEILKKGELPKLHPSPSSAPILFVLGKGREDYIEYCRRRVPYSDIQTIREVLKCMGAV